MTQEKTAAQQYDERQDAIITLLDHLAGDIAMHSRGFDKSGRRSWEYPGDLTHVRDLLQQAHNFLNNIDEE